MIRGIYSRDGGRLQGSARLPIVLSVDTGRSAYARVQSLRRQAATQARDHASAGPSEDPAAEGDNEQNVQEAEAAVLREFEIIDLTEDAPSQQTLAPSQGRYRYKQVPKNAPLESSHRARSAYRFGDIDLKPGTCVELHEPFGKWEVSETSAALLVKAITNYRRIDQICRDQVDMGFQV